MWYDLWAELRKWTLTRKKIGNYFFNFRHSIYRGIAIKLQDIIYCWWFWVATALKGLPYIYFIYYALMFRDWSSDVGKLFFLQWAMFNHQSYKWSKWATRNVRNYHSSCLQYCKDVKMSNNFVFVIKSYEYVAYY